jgi:hypothetical protein
MANEIYGESTEACYRCATACERCGTACLHEKEIADLADCVRLTRDCAEICRLAAAWMARNNRFAGTLCEICAVLCNACDIECAKHPIDHCQACADECRRCAELCRRMVGGAVPEATTSIGVTG